MHSTDSSWFATILFGTVWLHDAVKTLCVLKVSLLGECSAHWCSLTGEAELSAMSSSQVACRELAFVNVSICNLHMSLIFLYDMLSHLWRHFFFIPFWQVLVVLGRSSWLFLWAILSSHSGSMMAHFFYTAGHNSLGWTDAEEDLYLLLSNTWEYYSPNLICMKFQAPGLSHHFDCLILNHMFVQRQTDCSKFSVAVSLHSCSTLSDPFFLRSTSNSIGVSKI